MPHRRLAAVSALALLFCPLQALAQATATVSIAPVGATVPTAEGGANAAALLYNSADPGKSVIAATGELGGLEFHSLDGARKSALPGGETYGVDVRDDLIAVLDRKEGRIRLSRYDFAAGQARDVEARPLMLGYAGEGLCLHKSPRDGSLYAFALGGEGQLDQWLLYPTADGKLDGRLVRRLHLSSEAKYCVADDASGALYVSQEAVGIWRYDADPEAEAVATIVDINRLGRIKGEGRAVSGDAQIIAARQGRRSDHPVRLAVQDEGRVSAGRAGHGLARRQRTGRILDPARERIARGRIGHLQLIDRDVQVHRPGHVAGLGLGAGTGRARG